MGGNIMKKHLALAAVPGLVAAAAFGLPAHAAPASSGSATIVVTLASGTSVQTSGFKVGDHLSFAGCGYTANVGVSVTVQTPTALAFFGGIAGSDGCFAATNEDFVATVAGDYSARTYQSGSKKAKAVKSFSVSS